jgi:hypothetical protein
MGTSRGAEESAHQGESGEEDLERLVHARALASGYREAARRAVELARVYRAEEGPGGRRERACVEQALAWRRDAREVHRTGAPVRPGLARARPIEAPDAGATAGAKKSG